MPVPVEELPVMLPRDIEPTGEGNPLAERPDFVDARLPEMRRARQARDRHPRLPLRRALALGAGRGAAGGPRRGDVRATPTCGAGCPAERLVAGNDSGGFVFDQRIVTKALRDIGPLSLPRRRRALRRLPLPRDGDRRRAQDEQAPRQRGRPRRAGRALRRRHRAPRRPLCGGAGEDPQLDRWGAALRPTFPDQPLGLLARRASPRVAEAPRRRGGGGRHRVPARAAAQMVRQRPRPRSPPTSRSCRCTRRSATSPASSSGSRTSRSASSSAAAQLSRDDAEALVAALVLLARILAPFAPHAAEELLVASGREDGPGLLGPLAGARQTSC